MQRYIILFKKRQNEEKFAFFYKKVPQNFVSFKKSCTFAPAFQKCDTTLGYGVMVTLQILVLPFLVRVRVPQHLEIPTTCKSGGWIFLLSKLSSNYRSISENSIFEKIGDAIIISITAPHGFIKNRH